MSPVPSPVHPVPTWPAIQYETVPWVPSAHLDMVSRAEARRHVGPYQAAIPVVIAKLPLSLPDDVVAEAEDAGRAITRFDAEAGGELAPLSAVLLRSESAASSQIENLTASARAIAQAELSGGGRSNASLVVANVRATTAALALADDLSAATILAMHRALMEASEPDTAGRWRDTQVWIGGSSIGPHAAAFVPPVSGRVSEAMDDLIAFLRRDDLPVLPQAAVAHAQFETIHPFPDGNGRTGRALVHSLLRNKGLARTVTVPVSAGLLTDTPAYFRALDAFRAGDLLPIVAQLSAATFAAVRNGRQLIAELREARRSWDEVIVAQRGAIVWRLADLLLRHPVVDAALVARELDLARTNVYRLLDQLEAAGVLTESTDRRRNRVWRSRDVIGVLDAFATRAGRRVAG